MNTPDGGKSPAPDVAALGQQVQRLGAAVEALAAQLDRHCRDTDRTLEQLAARLEHLQDQLGAEDAQYQERLAVLDREMDAIGARIERNHQVLVELIQADPLTPGLRQILAELDVKTPA